MDRKIWKHPEIIHHYLTSAVVYYLTGRRDYWKTISKKLYFDRHLIKTPVIVPIDSRIQIIVYDERILWNHIKSYEISYHLVIDDKYIRDYTGILYMDEWRSDYLLWKVEINRRPQSRLQHIRREDAVLINRWSWDVRNATSRYELCLIKLGVGPYIRYS